MGTKTTLKFPFLDFKETYFLKGGGGIKTLKITIFYF